MNQPHTFCSENKERFLQELIELLKLPSVSADSAFSQDVLNTAEAVSEYLRAAGCDGVEICETKGYPIVYGEKLIDPSLPTILVYGHYDVQPPDPVELWNSPPFEPVIQKTALHPLKYSCVPSAERPAQPPTRSHDEVNQQVRSAGPFQAHR